MAIREGIGPYLLSSRPLLSDKVKVNKKRLLDDFQT